MTLALPGSPGRFGSGANCMTSQRLRLHACDLLALLGRQDCIPDSNRTSIPKMQLTDTNPRKH
jgi:hypothetical protein